MATDASAWPEADALRAGYRAERARARAERARSHGKLIGLAVVVMLALFLAAKAEFRSPTSNDALYLYGVTVTSMVLVQMAVAFGFYRDPSRAPAVTVAGALAEPALVTCLVAVHNEEDVIVECIASLARQTYRPIEIIVVDDASTDGTLETLRLLDDEYDFRVIALDQNVGKKRALAEGILAAKGTVYAFTDSDSVWAPDALEHAMAAFASDPEIGAVSGHCRALNGGKNLVTKIQDSWYEGQFSVRKAFESRFSAVTCVSGPFAAFRKEAIYNFIPAWEADTFLGQEFRFATDRTLTGIVLGAAYVGERLRKKHAGSVFLDVTYPDRKWKVVYAKQVRSYTVVPDTFRRLITQQVRWKKSFLRNIFFTGRFYWRRPFPAAVAYYLHILFVLCGPLVAFRHLIYAPSHGNPSSGVLYLLGIVLIGSMFGLAYWREEPGSNRWMYRPLMSLVSTMVLSWLLFYALATIKQMKWSRA
jgi:cellulose synthase/poly-beta-1,6-N-acetylglucosamine synthase-like glycosyltransferase